LAKRPARGPGPARPRRLTDHQGSPLVQTVRPGRHGPAGAAPRHGDHAAAGHTGASDSAAGGRGL